VDAGEHALAVGEGARGDEDRRADARDREAAARGIVGGRDRIADGLERSIAPNTTPRQLDAIQSMMTEDPSRQKGPVVAASFLSTCVVAVGRNKMPRGVVKVGVRCE
jgi:hypothetical protein